jgi:hypothetical protein
MSIESTKSFEDPIFKEDYGPTLRILIYRLNGEDAAVWSSKTDEKIGLLKTAELQKIKKDPVVRELFKEKLQEKDENKLPREIYKSVNYISPLVNKRLNKEYEGGQYSISSQKVKDALNVSVIYSKIEKTFFYQELQQNEKTEVQILEKSFSTNFKENVKENISDTYKKVYNKQYCFGTYIGEGKETEKIKENKSKQITKRAFEIYNHLKSVKKQDELGKIIKKIAKEIRYKTTVECIQEVIAFSKF